MHVPVFWLRGKVICPMKTYVEANVCAFLFFTPLRMPSEIHRLKGTEYRRFHTIRLKLCIGAE